MALSNANSDVLSLSSTRKSSEIKTFVSGM